MPDRWLNDDDDGEKDGDAAVGVGVGGESLNSF